MTAGARSVAVFGGYLAIVAVLLVAQPTLLLGPLGFPPPADGWIHVIAAPVAALAYYYIALARAEVRPFLRATVPARGIAVVVFSLLVVLQKASPALLGFAAVDAVGAIWTHVSLASDG